MSFKPLHQLLRVASHLLDQAATEVRTADLEPVAENIDRGALASRGLGYEKLDQLTMEVLLGVR